MSQEAGTSGIPKNLFFSSETSFSCLWVTGYASHSRCSTQGSMVGFSTVLGIPTFGSPHGVDQVQQCCLHRIKLRTSGLTAQRSTTKPCDWWNFSPNVCVYAPEHHWTSKESKIKNSKIWPFPESNQCNPGRSPGTNALTTWPQAPWIESPILKFKLEQTSFCQSPGRKRPNDYSRFPHSSFLPWKSQIFKHIFRLWEFLVKYFKGWWVICGYL